MVKRYSYVEIDVEEDEFLTNYRYLLAIFFTIDILLSIAFIPYSIHLLSAFHKHFKDEHKKLNNYDQKGLSQASIVDSIVILIFIKLLCVFFLLNKKLVPFLTLCAFQIASFILITIMSFHLKSQFFNFIQFVLSKNFLYPAVYTFLHALISFNLVVFAILRNKFNSSLQNLSSSV